ncbi:MAG: class I SAM-dependent methyltransferase [Chloroflexota bacterium]
MLDEKFDQLINEALSQPFSGWDFSHIHDRWQNDNPPWDYKAIVEEHLSQVDSLLDMGTGGGEFLAGLKPLPKRTHATEAWQPNIPVAKKRLEPLGITVHGIKEKETLPFDDDTFDLIINRHEWFDVKDVYRILKPDGLFITQQVGGKNDSRLNELISGKLPEFIDFGLENNQRELEEANFEILRAEEAFPDLRFFDVGAIVYYLKVVEWQIPDFDVEHYREQLLAIHEMIERDGELWVEQHRFLLVGRKTQA